MVTFGFIENLFFISLALVFVLVLLLVYHFKNRITVAEKKSDSMYGLLTAVVKEIKTLRGMFGLGGGQEPETPKIELKSKTTPEVDVSASSEVSNTFAAFVEKTSGVSNVIEPREVITLEFAASDNKIVVSDVDDSDYDSNDSDDDSLSDIEEDDPKDDILEMQEEIDEMQPLLESNDDENLALEQVQEIDISNILSVVNTDEIEVDLVEPKPEEEDPIASHHSPLNSCEQSSPELVQTLTASHPEFFTPSIEQLRKMNINQLKTIASQLGISTDISKMKKPELISLIRGGLDS
jgi:hypothetical protein